MVAKLHRFLPALASILFGALGAFAFAPYHFLPLLAVSIGYYFFPWRPSSLHGFWWGIGYLAAGISWIHYPIHTFVEIPLLISYALASVVIVVYAACIALPWLVVHRIATTEALLYVAVPLWALSDILRSYLLGGFPWLLVGDALSYGVMGGLHPLVGAAMSGMIFVQIVIVVGLFIKKHRYHIAAMIMACYLILMAASNSLSFTKNETTDKLVALIPLSVNQEIKFNAKRYQKVLQEMYDSTKAAFSDSDVVLAIFPETAAPLSERNGQSFLQRMSKLPQKEQHLLTGIFLQLKDGFSNGIIGISNSGYYRYHKRKLVMFGEIWPDLPGFAFIAEYLNIPFSSLVVGPPQQNTLSIAGRQFDISICFEIAYPELFVNREHSADAYINVANEGWFGDTAASSQQTQIMMSRARELGKPFYRVSNQGMSGVITGKGLLQPPLYERDGILYYHLQVATGETPYNTTGNILLYIYALLSLLYYIYVTRRI